MKLVFKASTHALAREIQESPGMFSCNLLYFLLKEGVRDGDGYPIPQRDFQRVWDNPGSAKKLTALSSQWMLEQYQALGFGPDAFSERDFESWMFDPAVLRESPAILMAASTPFRAAATARLLLATRLLKQDDAEIRVELDA